MELVHWSESCDVIPMLHETDYSWYKVCERAVGEWSNMYESYNSLPGLPLWHILQFFGTGSDKQLLKCVSGLLFYYRLRPVKCLFSSLFLLADREKNVQAFSFEFLLFSSQISDAKKYFQSTMNKIFFTFVLRRKINFRPY